MRFSIKIAELLNVVFLSIEILASISALILNRCRTFLSILVSQMYFIPVTRIHWTAKFSSAVKHVLKSRRTALSLSRSGRTCCTAPSRAWPTPILYGQSRSPWTSPSVSSRHSKHRPWLGSPTPSLVILSWVGRRSCRTFNWKEISSDPRPFKGSAVSALS